MEDIVFVDYDVTCHTEGCGNAEITIHISAPAENPNFICGVCAKEITDTTKVGK